MELLKFYRGERKGSLLFISFLINVLALALPLAMLQVYDRIIPNQSFGTASLLLSAVFIAILLEGFLRFSRQVFLNYFAYQYDIQSHYDMAKDLQAMPLTRYYQQDNAYYYQQFQHLRLINDIKSGQSALAMYDLPFALIFLALVAYIGGWIVIIPLTAIVGVSYYFSQIGNKIIETVEQTEKLELQSIQLLLQFYLQIQPIKNASVGQVLLNLYRKTIHEKYSQHLKLETFNSAVQDKLAWLSQASSMLVLIVGAMMVLANHMTMGGLVACSILAGRALMPLMAIASSLLRYYSSKPVMTHHEKIQKEKSQPLITFDGKLNEKTTIKLNEINHLLGDNALKAVKYLSNQPYEKVEYLTPRPIILAASIMDNMTLYDSEKEEQAKLLLEQLGVLNAIYRLSHGLNHVIGNQAINQLSLGLEQVIALIRALLNQPELLILENSLSGLDQTTSKLCIATLKQLKVTVVYAGDNPLLTAENCNQLNIEGGSHE